jgi:hypothetical protein
MGVFVFLSNFTLQCGIGRVEFISSLFNQTIMKSKIDSRLSKLNAETLSKALREIVLGVC